MAGQWRTQRKCRGPGRRRRLLGGRSRGSVGGLAYFRGGSFGNRLGDRGAEVCFRPMIFRLGVPLGAFIVMIVGRVAIPIRTNESFLNEPLLDLNRNVFVDRTGVSLLLLHSQVRQQFENLVWLDFELPSQLIDSDFLHR